MINYVTAKERESLIKVAEQSAAKARKVWKEARDKLQAVRRQNVVSKAETKLHFGHDMIVTMRDKKGLTFSAIAKMIDKSLSNVRAHYGKAKRFEARK